jgi:hypothetical protein
MQTSRFTDEQRVRIVREADKMPVREVAGWEDVLMKMIPVPTSIRGKRVGYTLGGAALCSALACGGSSAEAVDANPDGTYSEPGDALGGSDVEQDVLHDAFVASDVSDTAYVADASDASQVSDVSDASDNQFDAYGPNDSEADTAADSPPAPISCSERNTCGSAAQPVSPNIPSIYGNTTIGLETQTHVSGDTAEWVTVDVLDDQVNGGATMQVGITLLSTPAQHFRFDAYLSGGAHDATPGNACDAVPVISANHSGAESASLSWPYIFGDYYSRTVAVHVYPYEDGDSGGSGSGTDAGEAPGACYANSNWTLFFQGN